MTEQTTLDMYFNILKMFLTLISGFLISGSITTKREWLRQLLIVIVFIVTIWIAEHYLEHVISCIFNPEFWAAGYED